MAAARVDIAFDQGADFSITVALTNANGTPWDLTGYTARAKIRQQITDVSPMLVFSATVNSPASAGIVSISANAATTAAVPSTFQLGYWEFDVVSGAGVVYAIYKGLARMSPKVTQ